jgi:hypothetical protein
MPGLTATEKPHWRDAIARRIDRRLDALKARHPALLERVQREAHAQALRLLGLAQTYAELESIQAAEAALTRRRRRAQRAMVAAVRGVPVEEVGGDFPIAHGTPLPLPQEVARAVEKPQAAHQDRLLADDPVGQEITRLEAGKENLLDTVRLAASPARIKQLWGRVAELLGGEPTPLEREALVIAPILED